MILSTLAKIMDCIVSRRIMEFLGPKVAAQQHGFLKGRSTVTNLLLFSNYVNTSFEGHTQVDAIFIDYFKAFDSVNHNRLCQKLYNVGIRGLLLQWIGSYLANRSQSVHALDVVLNSIMTTSGVPQGSHLGPLLFIIYINDAVDVLSSSCALIYADDIKIFRRIKSPLDASLLQRDLTRLQVWSTANGLVMNKDKCNIMCFTGVTIISNLSVSYMVLVCSG